MSTPDLSVLIPFYNEEGNVLPLLEEVHKALAGISFDIVCVNDCSDDATGLELAEAAKRWPDTVTVFTHIERAGKSAALFTGLKSVRGTWTQLIDGDGQNDINDTARLWPELIAGKETGRLGIIAGKRNSRNDSGFKWLQSRVANGVRRFMLRDDATDTGCGWKLIRTEAFKELPYFASMHRFLPALIKRAGWEVREERVNDRPRWHGQSKYGFLGRLGAGIFDLLGMFWLTRRGGQGIARERKDPRAK
ncbi:MAG: glycosyltransferase family 2 protein [Henriciella sp.]|nr:glycosyltransferase family 2 protein [Henriciella sp.]